MSAEIIPFQNVPRQSPQVRQERERQEYLARVKQVAADLIAEIKRNPIAMATKKTAKKSPAKKRPKPADKPLIFLQDPEEYKRVVKSQRKFAREIADEIEAGNALDSMARDFAALILRHWADKVVSDKPKGKQGPPPKFDPASEALVYALHVGKKGRKSSEVIASIADRVKASETAVRKGIKPYLKKAYEFVGAPYPENQ